ncbi:MAG TPA: serine/threonine-protein kinase, partial [bacterium]|nr:serine/threonine-protein kinase [bacterium]
MALTPGTKLGSYEIVGPLGAGGMGEVYRARDVRLDRTVAIKVLPDAFAQDADRLARFEREAKLLASLNHPNIAILFGFDRAGSTPFLTMEMVAGETLAARIAKAPLPLDEAMPLFVQIAHGLEDAHANGVVHRDLKPANIKLTPQGKIKILDFGLAKAFASNIEDGQDMANSPTITAGATLRGEVLGTASYMSPEQARGKQVDKRTDIWAFGCVLFETLTGVSPFRGETIADTLAAIVRAEPEWKHLPAETPHAIRRLLRRCLEKDVNRRLHDIADARIELEEQIANRDDDAPGT